MNKSKKDRTNAIVVGATFALIETLMVYGVNPQESGWVLFQGATFWFSCGVIVAISKTSLQPIIHSIFITVLMNIPWFIALSIIPKNYDHLAPLFIASIVFGIIGGGLMKWLNRTKKTV